MVERPLIVSVILTGAILAGCPFDEGVYVIGEAEGVAIIQAELEAAGVAPTDRGHTVPGVTVCPVDRAAGCLASFTLTLDGWDADKELGFEYVTDADDELPDDIDFTERDNALALGEAVNASLSETGGAAIVIGQLAHETAFLAREQLRGRVQSALAAAR